MDDVSNLARAMLDADKEVEKAEFLLKAAKEKLRVLTEETIPSVMQELGLTSLVLDTGQKLSVKQDVYASIPSGNKREAYDWLNENGFGGLIKISVDVEYGKGEAELAIALFKELQERGLSANAEESVHAQTLKAFLREQVASGASIPMDLFGARPVWVAKVTNK
jgi:hypothetical protein